MTSVDRSHNNSEINARVKNGEQTFGGAGAKALSLTKEAALENCRQQENVVAEDRSVCGHVLEEPGGWIDTVDGKDHTASESLQSIFDIHATARQHETVCLPCITTVVTHTESKQASKENQRRDQLLPALTTSKDKSPIYNRKTAKGKQKLFDFREPAVQQRARKVQVQKLKKSGLGAGGDSPTNSRYVVRPYEGAVDDFSRVKTDNKQKRHKLTPLNDNNRDKGEGASLNSHNETSDHNLDQETLVKIRDAFEQWDFKKCKDQTSFGRDRKRSSSHSPNRTLDNEKTAQSFNSSHNESKFLTHRGNLRRIQGSKNGLPGRTCRAIASPANSRRIFTDRHQTVQSPLSKTFNTVETVITPLPSNPSSAIRSPNDSPVPGRDSSSIASLRNRRLVEVARDTAAVSTSLPELHDRTQHGFCAGMERVKGHRPRASSLNKPRVSSAGKSPDIRRRTKSLKVPTKQQPTEKCADQGQDGANEHKASPKISRHVMLNTSLPVASPTFQRAMKGMDIPDKEYSVIFGGKRRDSILQSYGIQENAFNSFRDDNELAPVESSKDALEEMTNRFREDAKDYKAGWDPQKRNRARKSILKKRRQSVDDMDISTRKNLAKYLESTLQISDKTQPTKQLNFA